MYKYRCITHTYNYLVLIVGTFFLCQQIVFCSVVLSELVELIFLTQLKVGTGSPPRGQWTYCYFTLAPSIFLLKFLNCLYVSQIFYKPKLKKCIEALPQIKFILFLATSTWVKCDCCKQWYHMVCVDISPDQLDEKRDWFCPVCHTLKKQVIYFPVSRQGFLLRYGFFI